MYVGGGGGRVEDRTFRDQDCERVVIVEAVGCWC